MQGFDALDEWTQAEVLAKFLDRMAAAGFRGLEEWSLSLGQSPQETWISTMRELGLPECTAPSRVLAN